MGGSRAIGWIAALALGVSPAEAQSSREPLVMAPASEWVADYADDNCALRRAFAAGGQQVQLELLQFAPGDSVQVTISSPTLSARRRAPRVRFDPDDGFVEMTAWGFFHSGDLHRVRFYDSLKPNALKRELPVRDWSDAERDARERAVTGFTVAGRFERTIVLRTGELHGPMQAMRTCMDELMTRWGLDPQAQRTLSRQAATTNYEVWANRIATGAPRPRGRSPRRDFFCAPSRDRWG